MRCLRKLRLENPDISENYSKFTKKKGFIYIYIFFFGGLGYIVFYKQSPL